MIRPVELFLALRFVRSRETGVFVSFITWVSLLGVGLGVAALIVILSVMNGFESELRERLLSLTAHATLMRADGAAIDGAALADAARRGEGVRAAAPFVSAQALAVHGADMAPAMIRGVDPAREGAVTSISGALTVGRLADLAAGENRVLVGRALAFRLHLVPGDTVTVMVPSTTGDGELEPRIRAFTVAGLFEVGLEDHDGALLLAALPDVAALAGVEGATGVRLSYDDPYRAPSASRALARRLDPTLVVRDWTEENATYFHAVRVEKTMMTLILLLVVGVAAFNIVAMLVMVVRAKRTGIAILRTLGLEPGGIVAVFLLQGLVIGWGGTLAGALAGLAIATHVEQIVPWLERHLGFQIFDADVFYVTRIPSIVETGDVLAIVATALVLTLAATVYPARRAAATEPADVLRYE
jgi:lipoprotein-releasing system permease protein